MPFRKKVRLTCLYRREIDEKGFSKHFRKLYNKLFIMEGSKYLPPKFSYALKDLAKHYDIFEQKFSMSNFSQK